MPPEQQNSHLMLQIRALLSMYPRGDGRVVFVRRGLRVLRGLLRVLVLVVLRLVGMLRLRLLRSKGVGWAHISMYVVVDDN